MFGPRQPSFAAGEISPDLYDRVDLALYRIGLATCRNFIVRAQGGVVNRPGFRYVTNAKDETQAVIVIPWVFSEDQSYALEFGHQYIRVIYQGALVIDPSAGTPVEIPTPYAADQLRDIYYKQSGDVMFLAHPDHPLKKLTRTSHTNWTLADVSFGPSINPPAMPPTLVADDTTSKPLRQHYYKYTAIDEDSGEESAASPDGVVTACLATDTKGSNKAWIKVSLSSVSGASEYNVYRADGFASGQFGYIGTTKNLTFWDENFDPDYTRTPPEPIDPFDATDKYPSVVEFHEQRLLLAATNENPRTVWLSQVGCWFRFTKSLAPMDDESMELTLASEKGDRILAVVSLGQRALILLPGEERSLEAVNGEALTANTAVARRILMRGAADVRPILAGSSVIYLASNGVTVREMAWSQEGGGYKTDDVSVMAKHLFKGYEILASSYSQDPHSILWFVRDDGVLLGFTYMREQQVLAWHRHDTEGDFESICTIPEAGEDVLYAVVRRTVDGSVRRYIERMDSREKPDDVRDWAFLDSYLTYDGRYLDGSKVKLTNGSPWTTGSEVDVECDTDHFKDIKVGDEIWLDPPTTDLPTTRLKVETVVDSYNVTCRAVTDVPGQHQDTWVSPWYRAVDRVTGLDHLKGKTVGVLVDAQTHPDRVVDAGVGIDLQAPAVVVHAGLKYVSELETLDLLLGQAGSVRTRRTLVTRVFVGVVDTREVWAAQKGKTLRQYKPAQRTRYDAPLPLETGVLEIPLESDWTRGGRVRLVNSAPLPCTITAVEPEIKVGE